MLPFGSITSIIPLFVLACAYIIYFSATVLNRNNIAEEKIIQDEKILAGVVMKSEKLPDFRSIDLSAEDAVIPCINDYSFTDLTCSFFRERLYGEQNPLHGIACFLPRPPPSI